MDVPWITTAVQNIQKETKLFFLFTVIVELAIVILLRQELAFSERSPHNNKRNAFHRFSPGGFNM